MCRSQNVGSYEEAGEVSYTELQKGHEDLCRKEQLHEQLAQHLDGLWVAKSEGVGLIVRAISFQVSQSMWS